MPVRSAGALAAVAVALALCGVAIPASAGDAPTTIGVRNGTAERSFALSRKRVPPGPALIQYTNTGEDPHDVLIRRKGSQKVTAIGETDPGGLNTFPLMKLKRSSKYVLWCSLDGHRESGMEAALRVKKKRKRA